MYIFVLEGDMQKSG